MLKQCLIAALGLPELVEASEEILVLAQQFVAPGLGQFGTAPR